MLYVLFLALAIVYNCWKFAKNRGALLTSLIEAKSTAHREMILSHHFYVLVFEGFLAFIVAHFMSEGDLGFIGLGTAYLVLVFLGFLLYRYFVKYLERHTELTLAESFQRYLIRELRVNFALILLPILIYSTIHVTFQGNIYEEWGNFWFIGILFNLIFVSVLTIICTVIVMLKLIPNREIVEPEYLDIINRRLDQIQMSGMRVRWIETDIKNAFIVGIKILMFSNQTMFVGRSLRNMLSLEEFDAVISHELGHVANRHIHKRVIDLLKNFVSILLGTLMIMVLVFGCSLLFWGEDFTLHTKATASLIMFLMLFWTFFNYALLFDTIRSHEFEADAYAVMKLGVGLEALNSALVKLTTPDELPEYLKAQRKTGEKNWISLWLIKNFSTHPDLKLRISFLEEKIQRNLPFNYYVSSAQKVRNFIWNMFQWKIAVPATAVLAIIMSWTVINVRAGMKTIAWINHATSKEIMSNSDLIPKINSAPLLIGQNLMSYIVRKRDPKLIDFFLSKGADRGKTLVYISQLKDFELLEKYYPQYQNDLSEDEYFLILRKTAQLNFTQGYRYLVNAKQFEALNPVYKEDISKLHQRNREPASVKANQQNE
jgi:Zn-dependent protease with chaperone function